MAEKNKSKVDQAKEIVQKQADRLRHDGESETEKSAAIRSDSSDASKTSDEPKETREPAAAGANDGGLGEIRVAAEEVQGEGVPVTAGGDLDFSPRPENDKEQRQELIIPDDENLYPVIRTVNDPADQQSQADLDQQRIMEARRQQSFQDRETPVTERELRRRMNEQP